MTLFSSSQDEKENKNVALLGKFEAIKGDFDADTGQMLEDHVDKI